MKYRVRFTLPALVEMTVDIEAASQQEALVTGFDHALAATATSVRVVTVNAQSAMLDSCEALNETDKVGESYEPPPSPYAPACFTVQRFSTPESRAAGVPDVSSSADDFSKAIAFCEQLSVSRDDYARRVVDKLCSPLFELKSEFGRYVIVAFEDEADYANRKFTPWAGWLSSAKQAKIDALALLDAGKVFAVGVLDATAPGKPPRTVMTLTRSLK